MLRISLHAQNTDIISGWNADGIWEGLCDQL